MNIGVVAERPGDLPNIVTVTTNSPPRNLFENNPTVNAQCLSPRPRPKALAIASLDMPDRSPSRRPNLFSFPTNGNQQHATSFDLHNVSPSARRSRDELKSFPDNHQIKFNGIRYPCMESDLEYVEELGAGSCGQVAKYRHKPTGNIVAAKMMRRSGDDDETKRIVMDLGVLLKCGTCLRVCVLEQRAV